MKTMYRLDKYSIRLHARNVVRTTEHSVWYIINDNEYREARSTVHHEWINDGEEAKSKYISLLNNKASSLRNKLIEVEDKLNIANKLTSPSLDTQ